MYRHWYERDCYLTRIICKFMPALVSYINVIDICTYLLAEELLTFDERSEILDLKGKHRQVPHLFEILTTKGWNWYSRFWQALKNSVSWSDVHIGHRDLLEILPNCQNENDIHPNIETEDAPLPQCANCHSGEREEILLAENQSLRDENERLKDIIKQLLEGRENELNSCTWV